MLVEWPLPMYFIYTLALALWLLITSPYWLFQMLRQGKYREGLLERFGMIPGRLRPAAADNIWVHAVSVGEVIAISGLVNKLRERHPETQIVISTTTATGQRLARQRFGDANVFYFPLDFPFAIRAYLRALRPRLVVIAETELWPNFLRLAHASGARIAVVNARISDRSFPGYRRIRRWLGRVLQNIDLILAQTEEDYRRLLAIGASAARTAVAGNLKFDIALPAPPPLIAELESAFERSNAGPVLVCGSTVEGEEPLLLRAFEIVLARYPDAVMILAPRHPERFKKVAELISSLGIKSWRRSLWDPNQPIAGGVFLLDSIGELAAAYSLATIAFVGGSLAERGGHNILEAAQHGAPVMVGPHTENFREMVNLFRDSGALKVVGAAELPLVFMDLLADEQQRRILGQRALETLRSRSGATERTLQLLEPLLPSPSAEPEPVAAGNSTHHR